LDDLLTVRQVAERLNTSERFVRRLIEERRIPFHKLGRHVRISSLDLDAYIAASRTGSLDTERRAA
jgi:excisionase family DNA binding protein